MADKKIALWGHGLLINLFSNAVGLAVGSIVLYLKHEGSEWVSPLLFGVLAWVMTMGIWIAIRVIHNLPPKAPRITESNIQAILREWLDELGLKIQSVKDDSHLFFFIVTTDGGRVISISRDKETPDHLTYRALYSDPQSVQFADFTDEEKTEARLLIQLEVSRAVMGYKAPDILCDFTMFKKIPLTPTLSIEDVSSMLWRVEAAFSSVFLTGALLILKKRRQSPPPTVIEGK